MKAKTKLFLFLFSLVFSLSLTACADATKNESDFTWGEDDFSFYNTSGKEIYFPTVEDYWINMSDSLEVVGSASVTKRGLSIGDKATSLSDLYDLKDFEYSICDYNYINPSTDKADEADIYFHEKASSLSELIKIIDQVAAKDLDVYAWCDIYKVNGELLTSSSIDSSDLSDNDFCHKHLKYSIAFKLDGEKVADVDIESNYHNYLNGYGDALDDPSLEWLIEMGK